MDQMCWFQFKRIYFRKNVTGIEHETFLMKMKWTKGEEKSTENKFTQSDTISYSDWTAVPNLQSTIHFGLCTLSHHRANSLSEAKFNKETENSSSKPNFLWPIPPYDVDSFVANQFRK